MKIQAASRTPPSNANAILRYVELRALKLAGATGEREAEQLFVAGGLGHALDGKGNSPILACTLGANCERCGKYFSRSHLVGATQQSQRCVMAKSRSTRKRVLHLTTKRDCGRALVVQNVIPL